MSLFIIEKKLIFGETWGMSDTWTTKNYQRIVIKTKINSDLGKVGGSQISIKEGEKKEEGMNGEHNVTLLDCGLTVCL